MKRKLNAADVREIMRLWDAGYGAKAIAKLIGRNRNTVNSVCKGQSWREVTGGKLPNRIARINQERYA